MEGWVLLRRLQGCQELSIRGFNKKETSSNAPLRCRHAESTWVQDLHTQSDFTLSFRKILYCCLENQHFLNPCFFMRSIVDWTIDMLFCVSRKVYMKAHTKGIHCLKSKHLLIAMIHDLFMLVMLMFFNMAAPMGILFTVYAKCNYTLCHFSHRSFSFLIV